MCSCDPPESPRGAEAEVDAEDDDEDAEGEAEIGAGNFVRAECADAARVPGLGMGKESSAHPSNQ